MCVSFSPSAAYDAAVAETRDVDAVAAADPPEVNAAILAIAAVAAAARSDTTDVLSRNTHVANVNPLSLNGHAPGEAGPRRPDDSPSSAKDALGARRHRPDDNAPSSASRSVPRARPRAVAHVFSHARR
jgi:hypothetical protein